MEFNIKQIIKMLPHSYPFLLIDRVIECIPNQSALGIKNVTFNEPFFIGHFPNNPIMPGVLIVESMAQTCAICALSSLNEEDKIENKSVYFMSIEGVKFRHPVTPGDVLNIKVSICNQRKNVCKFECKVYVEDKLVAEAIILAMINISSN